MILLRDKQFASKYTPEKLEEYVDPDTMHMSPGQLKDYIVEEGEKAARNRGKYIKKGKAIHVGPAKEKGAKTGKKWGTGIGAVGGAGIGLQLARGLKGRSGKIGKVAAVVAPTLAGSGIGYWAGKKIGGSIGKSKGEAEGTQKGTAAATKEGHVGNKERQLISAKKIDADFIKHHKVKDANYDHQLREDWKKQAELERQRRIEEERLERERAAERRAQEEAWRARKAEWRAEDEHEEKLRASREARMNGKYGVIYNI